MRVARGTGTRVNQWRVDACEPRHTSPVFSNKVLAVEKSAIVPEAVVCVGGGCVHVRACVRACVCVCVCGGD